MHKSTYLPILFLFIFNFTANSQKKSLIAKSTTEIITIDGKFSENSWITNTEVATDFVMFEPDNGKQISADKKTDIKVLYDNEALYILAVMHDNAPEKIQKEVTKRDVFGVSDHFSVSINGFNDGQQDFRFYVSAAGVQMDCLATEDNEDFSWDGIWESKVGLTDFGWVVEMKIPYAALRFSNAQKQTWGLNFMREIKRDVQKYTWNRVDTKIGAVIAQEGTLEGIENIKPPIRLFFIPYTSAYYQEDDFTADRTVKAGLDIKYGISDSFTLDAILVPDFGQTKFDNAILNLEPFEQKLAENRPFFTEGTNLFNIGNIFYSRRIGGSPSTEPTIAANEEITKYPSSVDLINAVKVSGRTENGLGIGFLNGITEKTYATILNNDTKQTRKEVIQPLTNYNVLVFDQRFRQNSSISFVNTNTTQNGSFRDANVSALLFDLSTKANSYNLYGDFKYSAINDIEDYNGFKSSLNFAKTIGKYRYAFSGRYTSKEYDNNDLGINFYTNYYNFYTNLSYRILNPTKTFNTFKFFNEFSVLYDITTGKLQEGYYKPTIKATSKRNHYYELSFNISPFETFDFYEPRSYGRYLQVPKSIGGYLGVEFNRNNAFTFDFTPSFTKYDQGGRINYGLAIGPKYRVNDKFSVLLVIDYLHKKNDIGWVDFKNSDIIIANRNREILQNDLTGKYAINNKMTLNLTARYYWSYSDNQAFFTLQDNGDLSQNDTYTLNRNRNFNSWNFDLSYSWWFAPGSELSVLYRNYAQEGSRNVEKRLNTNLKNVFDSNMTNILSVSVRYFIDYNVIKNKF
ncbi:DUF5916 domain-containing protein [Flavobacterium frigoris]|uniref:Carbohydrate family 9 binding domain-like n=1 Tax=Flavobacterium frigoris TaxID=229204 RepID=A0A1H9FRH7_FLAFI|nr:DUF5916 domain-containing protein [Flavobacterium frigoris]SEQ40349.1 Carbohydrate family 9 binding domain-like [Flavobacterium frigoris]